MNYEEMGFREQYNEILFSERDVIEKFLRDQYDIRYGRQRDTWHFEPAVKMMMTDGEHVSLTDIKLDKNVFVMFSVIDSESKRKEYECGYFAYGELSKVIEALPNAEELNERNAEADLLSLASNGTINIDNNPYTFTDAMGNKYDVLSVSKDEEEGGKILYEVHETLADGRDGGFGLWPNIDADVVVGLRDHINIEVLHRSEEYKELMKLLALQENMRFECDNYGDATFVIDGTDATFDVSSLKRDDNGDLVIYGSYIEAEVCDWITLTEKDIKPQYLVSIIECMKPKYTDIMDTYNSHNAELVRKINDAWKSDKYHNRFGDILFALARRDEEEIGMKYGDINMEIQSSESAMNYAHEIMEGVCDDLDLQTILSFIRY